VTSTSTKRQVRRYLKQIGPALKLSRSKVAPHYEAIEAILGAGHSFRVAHHYLVEELQVPAGFSTMVEYVLRRRRAEAKRNTSTPQDKPASRAAPRSASTGTLKAASPNPAPSEPTPGMMRLGSVMVPEGGTSDWSVLSAIRKNAEQDFRELGEAAKRRRRERRRTS
jgi:hypothetical protein